jgi:hypothetical protein
VAHGEEGVKKSGSVMLRDCDFFEVDCLGGWLKVRGRREERDGGGQGWSGDESGGFSTEILRTALFSIDTLLIHGIMSVWTTLYIQMILN